MGSGAGIDGEEVEGEDMDEEGKVELCRVREKRSNSLRRASVLRDMMPFG